VTRRPASIILSVVFGLLTLNAWGQVLLKVLSRSDDPPMLTWLQVGIGLTGAATAWGSWSRARWAWGSAIAYGVMSASMLTTLPSLLRLPPEARPGDMDWRRCRYAVCVAVRGILSL
jgi:hypothetical protein